MIYNGVIFLSGLVAGFILFQSAINAPLLFKSLTIEQARPVLRSLFPVLFKVNAFLGAIILVLSKTSGLPWSAQLAGLVTLAGSILCIFMVGPTNHAADQDNDQKFKLLHRLSVLLTMVVLLANILWIYFI